MSKRKNKKASSRQSLDFKKDFVEPMNAMSDHIGGVREPEGQKSLVQDKGTRKSVV